MANYGELTELRSQIRRCKQPIFQALAGDLQQADEVISQARDTLSKVVSAYQSDAAGIRTHWNNVTRRVEDVDLSSGPRDLGEATGTERGNDSASDRIFRNMPTTKIRRIQALADYHVSSANGSRSVASPSDVS